MEKIAILTDSTSDLIDKYKNKDHIFVLPLYVNIDGSYLKDGIEITSDEVVAIGDAHNDLEMVVNSGLGVAMKNSDDILKQNADIITQYTNEQDGLAKFLEELFELRDYE